MNTTNERILMKDGWEGLIEGDGYVIRGEGWDDVDSSGDGYAIDLNPIHL